MQRIPYVVSDELVGVVLASDPEEDGTTSPMNWIEDGAGDDCTARSGERLG